MASVNPPTQHEIGDRLEFPAFQSVSTQKDGRCWLNHQFHGGLKSWGQPFYSVGVGNHTSSPHYSKMAHWKARAGIWRHWKQNQGMQKDCRCWLNHQFHVGLKGWGQPFLWSQHLEIIQVAHAIPKWPIERPGLALGGIGNEMKECKKMVCPSSLGMSSHGTGPGSRNIVPLPEASLIKWSMAADKNNLDHACTAKTWPNLDRFQLQP